MIAQQRGQSGRFLKPKYNQNGDRSQQVRQESRVSRLQTENSTKAPTTKLKLYESGDRVNEGLKRVCSSQRNSQKHKARISREVGEFLPSISKTESER